MKNSIIFVLLMLYVPTSTYAWDGTTLGTISHIEVTAGSNYAFRIALEDSPVLCGNDHTWAYVNESDSNYQIYVAALLSAYMAKKGVSIYTTKETSSGEEYCHIGHIALH